MHNDREQKNKITCDVRSFIHEKKNCALAGSRTRIYCLEGSNADRYTTNALLWRLREWRLLFPAVLSWHIPANCLRRHTCTQMQQLASYMTSDARPHKLGC